MPETDTMVRDVLADITAASLTRQVLSEREHMIARIAALVAVDAPPMSYMLNFAVAGDVGVTPEDVEGVMVAVAPVVGTARVTAAAGHIARALGIAVAIADSDLSAGE